MQLTSMSQFEIKSTASKLDAWHSLTHGSP